MADNVRHKNTGRERTNETGKYQSAGHDRSHEGQKRGKLHRLRNAAEYIKGKKEARENYVKEKKEAHEKYVYFWKERDIYSQWHESTFTIDGRNFTCAEQYMMYCKADMFDDDDTKWKIKNCRSPRLIKLYGRNVKGLNYFIWREHCIDVVRTANIAKFSQNEKLKKELFDTYPKILVEASPYDEIWGIGLHHTWKEAFREESWGGLNLLGYIITDVRDELMCDAKRITEKEKKVDLEKVKQSLKSPRPKRQPSARSRTKGRSYGNNSSENHPEQHTITENREDVESEEFQKTVDDLDLEGPPNQSLYRKQISAHEHFEYFGPASVYNIWHIAIFHADALYTFYSVGQFILYRKAALFDDKKACSGIVYSRTVNCEYLSALGKKIRGYDNALWKEHKLDVVKAGNISKFSQNEDLKEKLFQTYPKVLVYANPDDTLWGIGLDENSEESYQEEAWLGHNVLGYILTEVRDELMCEAGRIEESERTVCLRDLKFLLFEEVHHPTEGSSIRDNQSPHTRAGCDDENLRFQAHGEDSDRIHMDSETHKQDGVPLPRAEITERRLDGVHDIENADNGERRPASNSETEETMVHKRGDPGAEDKEEPMET